MKRMILVLTTLAIAGAGVQKASAGGCGGGWCTAAAVLGGVTAGLVVGQALASRPAYYVAPAPVYYPTPGYGYAYSYAPAPQPAAVYTAPARVVYAAPAPVVVYRPPVYVAPPVVSIGFGNYGGCGRYYHR